MGHLAAASWALPEGCARDWRSFGASSHWRTSPGLDWTGLTNLWQAVRKCSRCHSAKLLLCNDGFALICKSLMLWLVVHPPLPPPPAPPRSGELRTQKLKSHLLRTQSFNVLPLKPGVGQYLAIHATLTARDSFLISTLLAHLSALFPNLSQDFPVLALANTGSFVGPQNRIGHLVRCWFPYWVPAEYK